MSSKTKIVVLHLKELIYTGVFAVLGILFLILLLIMFLPGKSSAPDSQDGADSRFLPGKYTTSVILGSQAVDVEVVVDANNINSIRLVNLDEAVATMYPLMEPALNDLAAQICKQQSMEDLTYSEDNKYTAQVLMEAISSALSKAERTPGSGKGKAAGGNGRPAPNDESGAVPDDAGQNSTPITPADDAGQNSTPITPADSAGQTEQSAPATEAASPEQSTAAEPQ